MLSLFFWLKAVQNIRERTVKVRLWEDYHQYRLKVTKENLTYFQIIQAWYSSMMKINLENAHRKIKVQVHGLIQMEEFLLLANFANKMDVYV